MKRLLVLALFLAILLIPASYSEDQQAIAPSCESVSAFDYKGQTECMLHSQILTENMIMEDENIKLMDEVKTATKTEIEVDNPQKKKVFNLMLALSTVLFLFITTYTGYLYISSASYPEKREMAKMQLKNLAFIAIAIIAIVPILNYVNDISQSATIMIYNQYFKEDDFQVEEFEAEKEGETAYEADLDKYSYLSSVSPTFQLGARTYILSMQGRSMLVLTLMAIFPFIIILFFFEPVQEFGKFLIYLFLIEELVPVVFVIILAIAQSVIATADATTKMQIITAALFFSVLMHVVLILLAVLTSAFQMMRARRYVESGGV